MLLNARGANGRHVNVIDADDAAHLEPALGEAPIDARKGEAVGAVENTKSSSAGMPSPRARATSELSWMKETVDSMP